MAVRKNWFIMLCLTGVLALAVGTLGGEGPAAPPAAGKPVPADNQRCVECHRDYGEDYLAMRHAKGGAGCVKCHGESLAHSSDKTSLIAPQLMIAREDLNDFCMGCHPQEKLSNDHDAFLAGQSGKKYCTECHGQHLMAQRTRLWDKDTGKLLPKSAVKKLNAERQKPGTKSKVK
jgi:hypothetical protein